jgi:hypothetical protein
MMMFLELKKLQGHILFYIYASDLSRLWTKIPITIYDLELKEINYNIKN